MGSQPQLQGISSIFKVKGHLTHQQATERQILHHWHGNDRADHWAKNAILEFLAELFKNRHQEEQNIFQRMVERFVGLQPKLVSIKKSRGHVAGIKEPKPVTTQHSFGFQSGQWVCSQCGISTKTKGRWFPVLLAMLLPGLLIRCIRPITCLWLPVGTLWGLCPSCSVLCARASPLPGSLG